MRAYVAVFVSVFLAEMGDKTQLATLLFAANPATSRLGVLVAAAGALCVSTALAVLAGGWAGTWIPVRQLRLVTGVGFVGIGLRLLLARG
jgi:putative Ca2+/H+ antiporter (TMEM165/GDT1 family)